MKVSQVFFLLAVMGDFLDSAGTLRGMLLALTIAMQKSETVLNTSSLFLEAQVHRISLLGNFLNTFGLKPLKSKRVCKVVESAAMFFVFIRKIRIHYAK